MIQAIRIEFPNLSNAIRQKIHLGEILSEMLMTEWSLPDWNAPIYPRPPAFPPPAPVSRSQPLPLPWSGCRSSRFWNCNFKTWSLCCAASLAFSTAQTAFLLLDSGCEEHAGIQQGSKKYRGATNARQPPHTTIANDITPTTIAKQGSLPQPLIDLVTKTETRSPAPFL